MRSWQHWGLGGGAGTSSNVATPSRPRPHPGWVVATFLKFPWPSHIRIMQALRAASSGARSVPLTYSRTELLQFSPPFPSRRLFPLAYKSCTCSLLSFSVLPFEPAPSSALPFRKTPAGAVLVLGPALSPLQPNSHPRHLAAHHVNDIRVPCQVLC